MIHVVLSTEEGIVLDSFSVERTNKPAVLMLTTAEADAIALSKEVRDTLEYRYEVEDL